MTVGAITPVGVTGMGYNDPYFLQAYNSPNSNYQLAQQQSQLAQQQATAQSTAQAAPQSGIQTSPAF